jgi:protein-L-isoaspartate(D-aspartate) O-methyltransferase
MSLQNARTEMVERQLVRRGIHDPLVLHAFRSVPREEFVPFELREFAYQDTPLPVEEGQTISQPYIVAVTLQALGLRGGERLLEVGAGTGYAAAIASHIVDWVDSIERLPHLAETARERLERLGYSNVRVHLGDGSLGLPEHGPFDAIAVAAAAPEVPRALLEQLRPGGRLVVPVGPDASRQTLMRVTRQASGFVEEALADVRFVPLVGKQGWQSPAQLARGAQRRKDATSVLIKEAAEPLASVESSSRAVDALIERVGEARLVLLGEATHGTSEFYRMRARITRELIERKGFSFVAVEGDWPDAARIDTTVRDAAPLSSVELAPFARFPSWMWRNREVVNFLRWLHQHNTTRPSEVRASFHGLDMYSLFTSISMVLEYLDRVDQDAARVARARYGTLTPWQRDPAAYGQAVLAGRYASSEEVVVRMLKELLARRLQYARRDGERFFDAAQNARVVANAEHYYRAMYYGSAGAWNLRDRHMFETLQSLFSFHGPHAKGVVWAHNSHVGDASATEMSLRGELNLGQLCRQSFGDEAIIIGFGTDHGTVAAASSWGGPMGVASVRPSHELSYERLCHDSGLSAFLLHLRDPHRHSLRDELMSQRLERAIGVIYRPESELASHYFQASLPRQFDEYVWFDGTHAIEPLGASAPAAGAAGVYPLGL